MHYRYEHRSEVFDVNLERRGDDYLARIFGESFEVEVLAVQPGTISLRVDGRPVTLYWADENGRKWIAMGGCTYLLEKPAPRGARRSADGPGERRVRAPMPAQVVAVRVAEGSPVEKGQEMLLLEAMKMEIRIQAPISGMLVRLAVNAGDAVERDQVLAEIQETTSNE